MQLEISIAEQNLRSIISKTGLPLKIIAKEMGIKAEDFLLWWSGVSHLPQRSNFDRLSQYLGVDLECQKLHDTDFIQIKETLRATRWLLPDKYAFSPLSYVSSSKHILEFLSLQFGSQTKNAYLAKVGVPEAYFDDLNNPINLRFFEDILEEFIRLGNSNVSLSALSKALFLTIEESSLSSLFHMADTYEEAIQQIEHSTSRFDKNFDYRFSISHSGFELKTKPSQALSESMKNDSYGSNLLYKYRSTLFGNMVSLCGLPALKIEVRACISQGDSQCHYVGRFNQ